jgi:hypothetical protein
MRHSTDSDNQNVCVISALARAVWFETRKLSPRAKRSDADFGSRRACDWIASLSLAMTVATAST